MDAYDFRVLCNASAFSTESMLASASFSGVANSNSMERDIALMIRGEVGALLGEIIYEVTNDLFPGANTEREISSELFRNKVCEAFTRITDKRALDTGITPDQLPNRGTLGNAFRFWGILVSSKLNEALDIDDPVDFPEFDELFGGSNSGL